MQFSVSFGRIFISHLVVFCSFCRELLCSPEILFIITKSKLRSVCKRCPNKRMWNRLLWPHAHTLKFFGQFSCAEHHARRQKWRNKIVLIHIASPSYLGSCVSCEICNFLSFFFTLCSKIQIHFINFHLKHISSLAISNPIEFLSEKCALTCKCVLL